jgi:multidrug efflux pump
MLGADLASADQRPDVRRGIHHHGAEAVADAGVGQVSVGGSALPAVRVELNPTVLNKYGISFETVRSACWPAPTPTFPKGIFPINHMWEVGANDQLLKAVDYEPLVIAYRNGAAVRE